MKTKSLVMLTAATLSLAACGDKTKTVDNTTVIATANETLPAPELPSAAQTFANSAASGDAFEIATSKLALTASKSASIKKFAQNMIDAHTTSTVKLKAAAGAITPDPTLSADQQAKLTALETKTGADFDQAYIAEQAAAHQQTLDVLKGYAASGDVPELKAFATGLVPTVTAHLNMAKSLKP